MYETASNETDEQIIEVVPEVKMVKLTFTASSDFTKTVLNPDRSVSFSPGDIISVFANGTNYPFTTEDGGDIATFSGEMAEEDISASTFYALFPYSASATIEGEVIQNVTLAKTSSPVANGYAPQQAIFVAKSSDKSFTFKPVCALLKITVPSGMTDLKAVDVFNRQSGLDGSLTGTFDVDMSGADPGVTVTADPYDPHTVTLQAASTYSPGVYYIPVLPAHLTYGIDLKMTYSGSYVGRTATGVVMTLEAGNVYNLGVLKKTKEFIYSSFENGFAYSGEYNGNDGISIIDNPLQNSNNTSPKVLRLDMHTRSANSSISGYIDFSISDTKFPISNSDRTFRKFFKTFKIKMYWGEINSENADLRYYPQLYWDKNSSLKAHPARLNGATITDQASFDAAYRANDWNELEWDYSQFTDKNNWGWLSSVRIRNFVNWSDNGLKTGDGYNLIVHWDDVAFVSE